MFVLLCEIPIVWESRDANLARYDEFLNTVFERLTVKPDIVVFPEFFTVGFSMNPVVAEGDYSPSISWLRSSSKRFSSAFMGSVPVIERGKYYNRACFVTPDGEFYKYDKRHIFSYGGEDDLYSHGGERSVISYNGWNVLLQICYDLRFPVWSRNRNLEYDSIINIANWPSSRESVIEPLIRARAIENLSYYIFTNRVGEDISNSYSGGSGVVDFKGNIMVPSDGGCVEIDGETFFYKYYQLSLVELKKFREKFAAWRDADNFKIL